MSNEKIHAVTVLNKTQWADNLFSFCVSRPTHLRFTAGQFVRLGVNSQDLQHFGADPKMDTACDLDQTIFRAYSIVSSPFDEHLEFFSIVIDQGAFTSQLKFLQAGDRLWLDTTPYGFLTLARYQKPDPHDLWLLATGTGVAPFLSILQDPQTWQSYRQIVLAYSARTQAELAYLQKIADLAQDFGALVDNPAQFCFIPILTRQTKIDTNLPNFLPDLMQNTLLGARLPALLWEERLQQKAGFALQKDSSHVMLCGNPQMVEETKETLKNMGLTMNRRGEGNIAVENYW